MQVVRQGVATHGNAVTAAVPVLRHTSLHILAAISIFD